MNVVIQDNRLRDQADRRGYLLVKSRRRDKLAVDFGRYLLVPGRRWHSHEPRGGGPAATRAFERGHGLTADQMEAALKLESSELALLPVVVKSKASRKSGRAS